MIRSYVLRHIAVDGRLPAKLCIKAIFDHPYNDQAWIHGVQDAVDQTKNELVDAIGMNPSVYLTGAGRDRTTWYLHAFGNYFTHDLVTPIEARAGFPKEVVWALMAIQAAHQREFGFEQTAETEKTIRDRW